MENSQQKLLIVDDNLKNLQVLGNILQRENYKIEFAANGKTALEWVRKNKFDLILLDIMMPEMDGFEVCEEIRSMSDYNDVPIILLSAITDRESILKGFEQGVQDYVTKPFDVRELLARVKTQLELKYGKEQLKKVNNWLEEQVKEKTSELEKALFELNKLDAMKTNFFSQISEEIKTPLNGIIGTINLVKTEDRSSAVKDMIAILEISLSRLESFISKATFSTQLSSMDYSLKTSELNLIELIKYAILEQNNVFQNKDLKITITDTSNRININADKDLIFKALNYLLDNAAKYSPNGSEIKISIISENDQVVLSIVDHGTGFSAEEIQYLLSPYRSDAKLAGSKTGISLQIVKQIMDLHGGKIIIKNNKEGGACIQLIFNL
jgi:two-component system sensor histidine kinase/response regulator